ncbi:hemoglobin/transferrin/lactoferrin receptor protein [Agrobacterium larrymoorei]|uniref:Hemoglobin/transferrin/lactoferrin receptor protein n=1 Tax=Agrobacterium larrymoorei TaxID=160699 RepID=A0AAJ2ERZ9_9HYPH|nr:TonB-dependent receptor [Agrobacterium larrymoorei]MDR6100973.1 hemoglobin/transferrin/lactoferrin receptor protein [Agrobacterium larrymoorei]
MAEKRNNRTIRAIWTTALLMATALNGALVAMTGHARAQEVADAQKAFAIAPQPLASALTLFGQQSGLQISVDAAAVRDHRTRGVHSTLTAERALAEILAGSNLTYRFLGPRTVIISAHVDSGASSAEGATVLRPIVIKGSRTLADDPYRTAGSSTYISGEKIERFRGTSVGDMLSGTPGVLNGDNRNGAALDVNIRGMQGQGRVPVVVDGAQQETTVYRGYAGVAGRSFIDPDFIGSVMVEKGPNSSADGAGVIGGVVRMNTITPDDILLPDKSFGVRFKGGFNSNSSSIPPLYTTGGLYGQQAYPSASLPGSFGGSDGMDRPGFLEPTGGNGSVAAAYRSENLDIVAGFARRQNGNYHAGTKGDVPSPVLFPDCGRVTEQLTCSLPRPGWTAVGFSGLNRFRAGEEVLNTSQSNTSTLLKTTVRLPYDQKIDLGYIHYESRYGEIMPSQIVYSGDYGAYQATLSQVEMDTYTAKYGWNPEDSDLVNVKLSAWMTNADLTTPMQWYWPAVGTPADPTFDNYYGAANRRWGINAENTSRFDTAWGDLSFNYGGSFTHELIEPGEGANLPNAREGNRREASIFTSGEWKPTQWLTLNGSLRYSEFKSRDTRPWETTTYPLSYNGQVLSFNSSAERAAYRRAHPGSTNLPAVTTSNSGVYQSYEDSGFAPMGSVMVEPWDGIQFYSKYAEALRMPSLFETTRGFSFYGGDFPPGQANPLRPEHARTWEFGSNVMSDSIFTAGDELKLKASYFHNRVDNYLTRSLNQGRAYIVNIDYAKLEGVELAASYDAGDFFGDLSYTRYLRTEFCSRPGQVSGTSYTALCSSGGVANSYVINQLPPKDSLSLTLGMRALDETLTFGGRLNYIGNRPTTALGVSNSTGGSLTHVEWKPYTVVDLFASYKVNDNLKIDAAIDNVADTYYMDTLTLGLMPSPGRTFRLNLTAKF